MQGYAGETAPITREDPNLKVLGSGEINQAITEVVQAVMLKQKEVEPALKELQPVLAEILERTGPSTLSGLADELGLSIADFLQSAEALQLLGYAEIDRGAVGLTPEGERFSKADIQRSKELFAEAVRARAPLVDTIMNALERTSGGSMPSGFFLDVLRRSFGPEDARDQLDTAVDWGRYAELFEFDAAHDEIRLDKGA